MNLRTKILEKAMGLVNYDREKEYGTPLENFRNVAMRWSLTLSKKLKEPVSPREVAMLMADLKQSRMGFQFKEDSAVDLIGYTALANELPDELPVRYQQFFFNVDD